MKSRLRPLCALRKLGPAGPPQPYFRLSVPRLVRCRTSHSSSFCMENNCVGFKTFGRVSTSFERYLSAIGSLVAVLTTGSFTLGTIDRLQGRFQTSFAQVGVWDLRPEKPAKAPTFHFQLCARHTGVTVECFTSMTSSLPKWRHHRCLESSAL
jgi:hypothetical protein